MNTLYETEARATLLAPLSLAMALMIGCGPMPMRDYGGSNWPGPYSPAPASSGSSGTESPVSTEEPENSRPSRVGTGPGTRGPREAPHGVSVCPNPPNCTYEPQLAGAGTSIKPSESAKRAIAVRPETTTRETVSPSAPSSKSILGNQIKRNPNLDKKRADFGR